jgi:hypothetical protein
MDLALESPLGTAMLAGVPLAFPLDLDRSSVNQEVQRTLRAPVRYVYGQRLPAADQIAEAKDILAQTDQSQQALDKPGCLPQSHPEKDLHRQAGLDCGAALHRLPTTLASGPSHSSHIRIEPDRQRCATLERLVFAGQFRVL